MDSLQTTFPSQNTSDICLSLLLLQAEAPGTPDVAGHHAERGLHVAALLRHDQEQEGEERSWIQGLGPLSPAETPGTFLDSLEYPPFQGGVPIGRAPTRCTCGLSTRCLFRQAAMDEENPDCFLDGLIQYQRQEIQVHGEPKHFTDDVLGVILADIFIAGEHITHTHTHTRLSVCLSVCLFVCAC